MDELKLLKDLLLGDEKKTIDNIQHRLEDNHLRTEDVAEVLPHAIRQRLEKDGQLAQSLQKPIEDSLRSAIKRDINSFADLLFPVMGPAIRRSITESLRGMLQSINKTLDESFSLRGLSWRFESMRTGVPFYDIVLRNTLIYRVEQAFLIQPETGLLMQHMTAPDVPSQDPDAVSAMLTAIQDFASDSFSGNQPQDKRDELETVNMGEHTLWLTHGPHATLATVIRGVPPFSLREKITEALEEIHAQFSDELIAFNGDRASLYPTENILAECFVSESKEKEKKSTSWLLILIVLCAFGLLGWWIYSAVMENNRQNQLLQTLNATPGIVVINHKKSDGVLRIKGLKDPYSTVPEALINKIGYSTGSIQYEWHPYQSDDAGLILKRATKMLAPPESINLSLNNDILVAEGLAKNEWTEQATLISRAIPGVEPFDSTTVRLPNEVLLEQITEVLQPPEGIQLALDDGILSVEGEASNQWLSSIRAKLASFSELQDVQTHAAKPEEIPAILQAEEELRAIKIYFERGTNNLNSQLDSLEKALNLITQLNQLHQNLNEKCLIEIRGFTDGTGDFLLNQELAHKRAETVRQWMIEKGLSPQLLETTGDISASWDIGEGDHLAKMRRAEFFVKSNITTTDGDNR